MHASPIDFFPLTARFPGSDTQQRPQAVLQRERPWHCRSRRDSGGCRGERLHHHAQHRRQEWSHPHHRQDTRHSLPDCLREAGNRPYTQVRLL